MNTDFKSLERRYGTLLATKIYEEIARAELKRFSFYRIPETLLTLKKIKAELESNDDQGHVAMPQTFSKKA
jgi:hypothetical protein